MKIGFVVLLAVSFSQVISANADTFTYQCKVRGKTYPLKVDSFRQELLWRGKTFKTTELQAGEQDDCPRFGWRAMRGGDTFDFCTTTGNFASFVDHGVDVECDQD